MYDVLVFLPISRTWSPARLSYASIVAKASKTDVKIVGLSVRAEDQAMIVAEPIRPQQVTPVLMVCV